MPLYVYRCSNTCDAPPIEILAPSWRTRTDAPPCPRCGDPMERVPAAPTVQFKGSGWAKDGYA